MFFRSSDVAHAFRIAKSNPELNEEIAIAKLMRQLVASLFIVAAFIGAFFYLLWKTL